MQVAGLIPVGWYPTAVAVAADGKTLFVANGKGAGSHANPDGSYIANLITGSVSIIPAPDRATLARYTREVYALSPYSNARIRPTVRASDRPTEVKHVVYIIRENRTYDQVFGDRSEEHTSELQSRLHLVCRLLLEKKKYLIYLDCI